MFVDLVAFSLTFGKFGGIVAWINLPETLGKPLPETMEDAINLGKKTEIADTSQLPNYGTL